MAAAADDNSTTPPISIPRRRNSAETPSTLSVPTKHHHATTSSSASCSSADFELVSIKHTSYTSLRDILPSPAAVVHSPKPPTYAGAHSGCEIPIRNRLVKQAAWAYLQPMSTSPESHGTTVFHRLWTRFSDVLLRLIAGAFDCLLRSIQLSS